MKAILKKLYSNKTVKPFDVKLSLLNEIQTEHDERKKSIIALLETTITNLSFAQENLRELNEEVSYIDFSQLEDIYDKVLTLGIEPPQELETLRVDVENLEYQTREVGQLHSKLNDIESELSSIYNNIT